MTTTFKNMTPDEKRMHIIKDITGSLEESLESTRIAAMNQMMLLNMLTQEVDFDSGITKQPFTDLPASGSTSFVINSLDVEKTIDTVVVDLTDETLEDINPIVGTRKCLTTLLGQVMAKDVEKAFVDKVMADSNIPATPGGAPTWAGIIAIIKDMGASIFNTVGPIVVAVSLDNYLDLISTDELEDAKVFLKEKVRIVVSEHLTDGQIIVFHTHGLAGGFIPRTLEFSRSGGSQTTGMIGSYSSGYAWDPKYIRKIS